MNFIYPSEIVTQWLDYCGTDELLLAMQWPVYQSPVKP